MHVLQVTIYLSEKAKVEPGNS